MSGTKIQIRRDTASNWASTNPVLADGEQGRDTTNKKTKTGDGVTAWSSLAFDTGSGGGGPYAPIICNASRNVLSTDANGPVICTGNPVLTVQPGGSFTGTYKGTCSFASGNTGALTVLDERSTGATYPLCSLLQTDATTGAEKYSVVGSKA